MEFYEQQLRIQYKLLNHAGYYSRVRNSHEKEGQAEHYLYGVEEIIAWARPRSGTGNLYISRNPFTKNGEVAGISGFSVDVDKIREPKDRATTEDELRRTCEVAQSVIDYLGEGILSTSGNGCLILLPFAAVVTDGLDELVQQAKRFEKELINKFQTDEVRIDATNYAKALVRLMGCPNTKDPDLTRRRYARFLQPVNAIFRAERSTILERITANPEAATVSTERILVGPDIQNDEQRGFDIVASNSLSQRLTASDRLRLAEDSLARLAPGRRDDYDSWLRVGIALKEFGPAGFGLWKRWTDSTGSKDRARFSDREMLDKFNGFRDEQSLTVGTLKYWADLDSPVPVLSSGGEGQLEIRDASSIFSQRGPGTSLPGLSTGFSWLDEKLNGGYKAGNVYAIEAVTSAGKSVFAVQSAYNFCTQGKRVLIVTSEMSTSDIRDRFIAVGTGVSLSTVSNGRLNGSTGKVDAFVRGAVKYPLFIRESQNASTDELRACVEQIKPDVLIIDYFQNLEVKGDSRAWGLGQYARMFKRIAIESSIPVIVTAQLYKKLDFKTQKRLPSAMEHIVDCQFLNFASQGVLVLDWMPRDQDDGTGSVNVRWSLQKNTHGRLGETVMQLNRDLLRFEV